jgi:hypothetical protein
MVLTRHHRLTGPCSWGPACFVVPERHGKLQCLRGYAIFSGWCSMADAGQRQRKCHGLQDTDDCVLCSQSSETVDNLLVACVFSREVWYKVLQVLGLQQLTLNLVDSLCEWWLQARKLVPKVHRRGFDALVHLVGWMIWKERNAMMFRAKARSSTQLVMAIQEEVLQCDHCRYRHIRRSLFQGDS